jgi:phage terminase large subunit-like protein
MPELEDQLCLFTASGYEGAGSPDRADALVWAMTELFPGMVRKAADPAPPVDYGAGGWMG